jgi:hypothetical protein
LSPAAFEYWVSALGRFASDGYVELCSAENRSIALRSSARLAASAESEAPAAPRLIRGMAMAAMIPMITTTITSSIKLNALA